MYQVRETSMTIAVRLRATVERARERQRCFRLFGRIISEDVTSNWEVSKGNVSLSEAIEFAHSSWNYYMLKWTCSGRNDENDRLKFERRTVEFLCKFRNKNGRYVSMFVVILFKNGYFKVNYICIYISCYICMLSCNNCYDIYLSRIDIYHNFIFYDSLRNHTYSFDSFKFSMNG